MNSFKYTDARILVLDDQMPNLQLLENFFELKGFSNYRLLADSTQGEKIFKEYNPDILLLDLVMPGLDGFQILERLKTIIPQGAFFPILVLTADTNIESRLKALANGATDFITKPFDLLEVELRLKNLILLKLLYNNLEIQNSILESKVRSRTLELETLNYELSAARQTAEGANKLKSIFMDNMSHEMRTPLIPVIGFAELLVSELEDEEHIYFTNQILEGAKRLSTTLSTIIEFSQLESDRALLNLVTRNLSLEIKSYLQMFNSQVTAKNLYLTIEIEDENLDVLLDVNLFEKILFQLLHNAVKFTERGGVAIILERKKTGASEFGVIHIKDTGIGIDKNQYSQIFEPFRQGSEGLSRSHDGNGLGLALVKKMIEILGGHINFESEPGVGSVFSLWFPIVTNKPTSVESPDMERWQTLEELWSNNKNNLHAVLLIEDNASNRRLISKVLSEKYFVVDVPDGETGIQFATKKDFDLILIDINLGEGINGIEVLEKLRNMPKYSSSKIGAVTALAKHGDKEEFMRKGFDAYLLKPFSINDLLKFTEDLNLRTK